MPFQGTAFRASAGSEAIGVLQYINPLNPAETLKAEQLSVYGAPLIMQALTGFAGVSPGTAKDYPDDGTGIFRGGSTTTNILLDIALPSATEVDIRGMVLACVSGSTLLGQARKIIQWGAAGCTATVSPGFTNAPLSGERYKLLLDCFRHSELQLKVEFDRAKNLDASVGLRVRLYDIGQYADPQQTNRAFRNILSSEFPVLNTDDTVDSTKTNYKQSETYTVAVRGALGAKVRYTTLAGGCVAFYAGVD